MFCNPNKTFVNHYKSDTGRYLSSIWTTLEGFSARNPIRTDQVTKFDESKLLRKVFYSAISIPLFGIDSKVDRPVWGRFGGVNRVGMDPTIPGKWFPACLQGFTLGLQNGTHPVTTPLTRLRHGLFGCLSAVVKLLLFFTHFDQLLCNS